MTMYKTKTNRLWWFSRFGVDPGQFILGPVPLAQALTQDAVEHVEGFTHALPDPDNIHMGDTIHLVRPGSYGDMLLLTPIVKALRIKYPGVDVKVVCHPRYAPILHGVVDTVDYPVTQEEFELPSNHYFFLEGVLEDPGDDKHMTYVARYAKACGLGRIHDRKILYKLTPEEAAWAEDTYPKAEGKVRVGIQVRASAENRTYHRQRVTAVMAHLLTKDIAQEIYLFGAPGDIDAAWGEVEGLVNLSAQDLAVRMSVAVAKTCDVLLVPDSLFMHVAGALDIPALVLSGPFDPSITQAEQKTVSAMRGMGPCRFCAYHPRGGNEFPPGMRCAVEGTCHVINSFSPDLVAHNLKKILAGKPI